MPLRKWCYECLMWNRGAYRANRTAYIWEEWIGQNQDCLCSHEPRSDWARAEQYRDGCEDFTEIIIEEEPSCESSAG